AKNVLDSRSMNDHYFSVVPSGDAHRNTIDVRIAGRQVQVETAGGIFSPDGLDRGTQVLLDAVPDPPDTGEFLDIGSGWGPVALTMGLLAPKAQITAIEVNERAAALTAANAVRLGLSNIVVQHPYEVSQAAGFDLIWSNPPIRIGKAALHELLARWLPALNPGGQAWLVVAKKLGADSLLPWITTMLASQSDAEFHVRRAATDKGFRIIHIERTL